MLAKHKKKADIAAGIAIGGILLSIIFKYWNVANTSSYFDAFADVVGAVIIVSAIAFIYCFVKYTEAKGYSAWLGLLLSLLSLIGGLILVCLPDLHKDGKANQSEDCVPTNVGAKVRTHIVGLQNNLNAMSDSVKIALIVAVTTIVCVGLWIYFSPYHSCVRDGGVNFLCAGGSWRPGS